VNFVQQPSPPNSSNAFLFLDACAILNYVKPLLLRSIYPGKEIPDRVHIIKNFIMKCDEKGIKPNSTRTAYIQASNFREHFRREYQNSRGLSPRTIDRVIAAAEHKIKDFFNRIKVHDNLPNTHYVNVENFFKRYENDPRMIRVSEMKSRMTGRVSKSTLPDSKDMEILAQALTFPNLIFVTTDGHFGALRNEIEMVFGVCVITQDNVYEKLRLWGW
jgi:hypothetical protein